MSNGRPRTWARNAGIAGVLFVVALVAEIALSVTVPLNQDDSAAKIARELDAHRGLLILIATLSAVYVATFPVYLVGLHEQLGLGRGTPFGPLMLIGGALFVTLHGVSDVGIYLLLAGKLASYSAQHDAGLAYLLYLLTFALDSVGDIFGGLFMIATGMLVSRTGALPRWTARIALAGGALLIVQAPMLGGVVTPVGLVVDGLGFLLLIAFVLSTSVISLRAREPRGRSGSRSPAR